MTTLQDYYREIIQQEYDVTLESALGTGICQECGFSSCVCGGPGMNTYWESNGKYQDLYDALWFQVPREGKSERRHIELVRNIGKLYHDMFNNGFGNLDVLMNHWRNLSYSHTKFCGQECAVEDFKAIDCLFDDWMEDDEIGGDWFYDEMIQRRIWTLMEKLCNAVILYAAKVEGVIE